MKINGKKTNVTSIGANAFANAKKVTKVTIPSTITSVNKKAFKGLKTSKLKITIKGGKKLSKSKQKKLIKKLTNAGIKKKNIKLA
jgi:hypothetical protein